MTQMVKFQLTEKQMKLLNFVIGQHGQQVRKYNLEPYWFHLVRVAILADEHVPFGAEIGLCHDLIEDVPGMTLGALTGELEKIGYTRFAVDHIVSHVYHLTDQFTSEEHPTLNRVERKKLEAHRLWQIPPTAQTVKLCDLLDNTSSIVSYDQKFAKVYLAEKEYILSGMNKGEPTLHERAMQQVQTAKQQLGLEN